VDGSRTYVDKLTALLRERMRLGVSGGGIRRFPDHVEVVDSQGHRDRLRRHRDRTHSDEALALLADATPQERDVLSRIPYAPNEIYVHRDIALMPKRGAAWSSWNLLKERDTAEAATVTYWMNRLQASTPRVLSS
jgi:predicted NAD/FAD-binding protein